ncbi:MAG: DNA-binding transcriptional LysR family regulator [Oceanicoccus sp.]|jgi:DNA-binding transcriptional LysR family regulator
MDKFLAMQRFLMVAQTGSFTRAADILDLPKSSVSAAVQGLEKQLGVRLLHRSTRSVTLTLDGESYLGQCHGLLSELEAIESQYQSDANMHGVLKVDMPSRFASDIVLPHLSTWLETHPNIQLKVSTTDFKIDPIKEGVDCIIRAGDLQDSSLIAKPLTTYNMINCVSPSYIAQYGEPKTIDDLQQHMLIDYAPKLGNSRALFEYLDGDLAHQLPMKSQLAVNSTDAYLHACLAGLGIIQVPDMTINRYLENGQLIEVLPNYRCTQLPVWLLYPSRRNRSKKLTLFIEWLTALIKTLNKQ